MVPPLPPPKQHTVTEVKKIIQTEQLSNIARKQSSLTVHKRQTERKSLRYKDREKTLTKKRVSDYTVQYNPWAV